MYYGNKSVTQMDEYYGIDYDGLDYPHWQYKECEKIQQAFNNHAIMLTLAECKTLYKTWSSECYCASWELGIEDSSEDYIFDLLIHWLVDILGDKIDRITVLTEQLNQNGYN